MVRRSKAETKKANLLGMAHMMQKYGMSRVGDKVARRPDAETVLKIHEIDKILGCEPSYFIEDPYRHQCA